MLKPVRTAPPADPPVSLEDVKAHLRVYHDDDDTLIGAYIQAAVGRLDGHAGILGRCMVEQSWSQAFDCWPSQNIRLPFPDVSEVTSVVYSDTAGADQTLSPSLYRLQEDELSAYLWLRKDFSTPSLYDDRPDLVRVTFKAGYGAADDVPFPLKAAIFLMVGDLYENREDTVIGVGVDVRPLPRGVDALIAPYRRVGL